MRSITNDDQPSVWLEVAAALLVPAAAFGFSRVFVSSAPLIPIIGAALLSSTIAIVCRRLRLPLIVTALVSAALLAILIANRYAPGTSTLGIIPTGETINQLRAQFDELVRNFRELQTPVEALEPFVAAAMVGSWIMAFLTDWGAMRLRLAFEPVLPSALMFVFTSIPPVSAQQNQLIATIVFAAAVAFWAVAQRTASIRERGVWLADDRVRGPHALAKAALAFAAVALVAGALIGPRLPGVSADPMVSFANQGDSTRKVVSPYVKIRSRLTEQTNQELFTVETDARSYWRMAGLDFYEKGVWKLAGDFARQDGDLPSTIELGGERREITQRFEITALAAIWLPAAFPPTRIVDTTADMTWHAESSSLTVDGDTPDGDGVTYTIVSSVGNFSAEELRAAPPEIPQSIADIYLGLPSDLPAESTQTAQAVTQAHATRYDKMLALQNFFRDEFTYNVNPAPSSGHVISQFLQQREGFCQDFAGTFAVMARQLGIPSRVALGFTWGDLIETTETGTQIYRVTGAQTHAWPEVYFAGHGWVPFEPTPGRGLPNGGHTGVEEAQDSSVPTQPLPDLETPPTTIAPQEELTLPSLDEAVPVSAPTQESFWSFSIPWRFVLPFLLIAAYLLGMPLVRQGIRSRRRSQAVTRAGQVDVCWEEAADALDLGFALRRSPSETRTEFAERLKSRRSVDSNSMIALADLATVARFYPSGVTERDTVAANGLAQSVEGAMRDHVPGHTRYFRKLNPLALRDTIRSHQRRSANSAAEAKGTAAADGQRKELADTGAR